MSQPAQKINNNGDQLLSRLYFQHGGHNIAAAGSLQTGIIELKKEKNCVVLSKFGSPKNPFIFPENLPRNKKQLDKLGFTIEDNRIQNNFWTDNHLKTAS